MMVRSLCLNLYVFTVAVSDQTLATKDRKVINVPETKPCPRTPHNFRQLGCFIGRLFDPIRERVVSFHFRRLSVFSYDDFGLLRYSCI